MAEINFHVLLPICTWAPQSSIETSKPKDSPPLTSEEKYGLFLICSHLVVLGTNSGRETLTVDTFSLKETLMGKGSYNLKQQLISLPTRKASFQDL